MGKLILVPTPISDDHMLCPEAFNLLQTGLSKDAIIAVEEHKVARRRWLKYGLPREAIENFVLYNEHTYNEQASELLRQLKAGKDVYLLSDCGLPAFCDPGRKLVESCHFANIKVTATPFANSIALAIALSGLEHERFMFEGFIPVEKDQRIKTLKNILAQKHTSVVMDTPYRLHKLLAEISELEEEREVFLGCDLNKNNELLLRGPIKNVLKKLPDEKKEFILVIEGKR